MIDINMTDKKAGHKIVRLEKGKYCMNLCHYHKILEKYSTDVLQPLHVIDVPKQQFIFAG